MKKLHPTNVRCVNILLLKRNFNKWYACPSSYKDELELKGWREVGVIQSFIEFYTHSWARRMNFYPQSFAEVMSSYMTGTCTSFGAITNLKVHEQTHTGETSYICRYRGCARRFAACSNLQYHARTHTGEQHRSQYLALDYSHVGLNMNMESWALIEE